MKVISKWGCCWRIRNHGVGADEGELKEVDPREEEDLLQEDLGKDEEEEQVIEEERT